MGRLPSPTPALCPAPQKGVAGGEGVESAGPAHAPSAVLNAGRTPPAKARVGKKEMTPIDAWLSRGATDGGADTAGNAEEGKGLGASQGVTAAAGASVGGTGAGVVGLAGRAGAGESLQYRGVGLLERFGAAGTAERSPEGAAAEDSHGAGAEKVQWQGRECSTLPVRCSLGPVSHSTCRRGAPVPSQAAASTRPKSAGRGRPSALPRKSLTGLDPQVVAELDAMRSELGAASRKEGDLEKEVRTGRVGLQRGVRPATPEMAGELGPPWACHTRDAVTTPGPSFELR